MEHRAAPTRGEAGGAVFWGHAAAPPALPVILDGQDKRRMHKLADALRDGGWPEAANAIHTFVAQQNLAASSHALAALRSVPADVLAAIPAAQPTAPMSDAQVEIARKRLKRGNNHG